MANFYKTTISSNTPSFDLLMFLEIGVWNRKMSRNRDWDINDAAFTKLKVIMQLGIMFQLIIDMANVIKAK